MQPTSDRLTRANFGSSGRTGQQSAETPDLFVYGTLAINDVIAALIDRVPAYTAASAPGWRAVRLPGLPYPGLVPDPGEVARGRAYTDLTYSEWVILDAFENPTYTLTEVRLAPSARRAFTYVWPEATAGTTWRLEDLASTSLADYLSRCTRWRRTYETRANDGR